MKKTFLLFLVPIAIGIGFLISCSHKGTNEDSKSISDSVKVTTEIKTELPGQSEITCPKCGFKKMETMPTDVCLLKYTCTGCRAELLPKEGDCCVFCTYGTEKCPSKQ